MTVPKHGTRTTYKNGCRCAECTAANAANARAKRLEQLGPMCATEGCRWHVSSGSSYCKACDPAAIKERFWAKVDKAGPVPECRPDLGPCWLWTASQFTGGYGCFTVARKVRQVHRLAYEWLVGPIPEGLVIDHLCRVKLCVNPSHLEVVTQRENVLRGEGITSRAARQERQHA